MDSQPQWGEHGAPWKLHDDAFNFGSGVARLARLDVAEAFLVPARWRLSTLTLGIDAAARIRVCPKFVVVVFYSAAAPSGNIQHL